MTIRNAQTAITLRQRRRSIFRIGGGGGGQKFEKCPPKKNRRALRAKSQYKTLRAERAAKMKIMCV